MEGEQNTITNEDFCDFQEFVLEVIDEYMNDYVDLMSKPHFHENLIDDITDFIYEEFSMWDDDWDYDELYEYIYYFSEEYFELFNIPKRSNICSIHSDEQINIEELSKTIQKLKSVYQPQQKSQEWHEYRHNLITASNIWKIFGSDAQVNSIIYEKCKPYEQKITSAFRTNPMQWGVMFEPISIKIYESLYNTYVDDFGCIIHDKYNFIGASPDGINVNPESNRYGRMIEVKNIVNREITSIPKEEYWIQMQVQMETCNLDECDFIETRIKEYTAEDDFYNDDSKEWRGVVLSFISKKEINNEKVVIYKYYPLDNIIDKENIDKWILEMKEENKEDFFFFNTYYWYLDEFSCVLVKRNRKWFDKSIEKVKQTWNTILYERVHGYEHRCAKKREQNNDNNQNSKITCLIKIDENGNPV